MKDIFWQAFTDAEETGEATIVAIATILFQRWKDTIKELTNLVMVINHKSWAHHDLGNDDLCSLYADLYYQYYEKAINYLENKGRDEDLTYFIRTLD